MLSATGIGYTLPDGRVLFADLDLHLKAGDAIAVEGPSGTGKSTLLAVLGGLVPPTAGRVTCDAPAGSEHLSPFAWVLQSLNCLTARSVLDNTCLLAHLDGEPPTSAEPRARRLLQLVGLDRRAEARARVLSGGELQRLAVARALTSSRSVILADEPTNQLDRDNARRVMQLLLESAVTEHRVVVVVTHDRDALPSECRRFTLTARGLCEST